MPASGTTAWMTFSCNRVTCMRIYKIQCLVLRCTTPRKQPDLAHLIKRCVKNTNRIHLQRNRVPRLSRFLSMCVAEVSLCRTVLPGSCWSLISNKSVSLAVLRSSDWFFGHHACFVS
jgi:hypothetical protein